MGWPHTGSFPEPTWWNGGEPQPSELCRDCGRDWHYGPCLCEAEIEAEPMEQDDLDAMCGAGIRAATAKGGCNAAH